MTTRALVALAVVLATIIVAAYLMQSLQRPLAAATPMVYTPLPEAEFKRLAVGSQEASASAQALRRPSPTPSGTGKSTPAPKPKVTPTPFVSHDHGKFLIAGWATNWPAQGGAASKWLAREMGGGFKYLGRTVRIWCYGEGCLDRQPVDVRLVTSCACGDRHGEHTVIDLPIWAFERVSNYGVGVVHVRVELLP